MNKIYKAISIFVILMLAMTTMASAVIYTPQSGTIVIPGPIYQVTPKVTVQTDKTTYYLGGPVKITIKNGLSQSINFNEIMVKNMMTGAIINTMCSGSDANTCPAIGTIVSLDHDQTYTTTWYPSSKGTYKAYIDWWTEGTVTCQAIGCPEPEPGISGRTYSNYFWVR